MHIAKWFKRQNYSRRYVGIKDNEMKKISLMSTKIVWKLWRNRVPWWCNNDYVEYKMSKSFHQKASWLQKCAIPIVQLNLICQALNYVFYNSTWFIYCYKIDFKPVKLNSTALFKLSSVLNTGKFFYDRACMQVNLQVGPKNRTCLSVDNSAMVTCKKACDMSKVLECCGQKGQNLHSKSFKYSLPNLHKSSIPLKLGICLHSHVPEFIELKNSLPKSPDLNSVNYSVWGYCNK